jgi:hypothetical protein
MVSKIARAAVLHLQEQQLRDDRVGQGIVNRSIKQDAPLAQEALLRLPVRHWTVNMGGAYCLAHAAKQWKRTHM